MKTNLLDCTIVTEHSLGNGEQTLLIDVVPFLISIHSAEL